MGVSPDNTRDDDLVYKCMTRTFDIAEIFMLISLLAEIFTACAVGGNPPFQNTLMCMCV